MIRRKQTRFHTGNRKRNQKRKPIWFQLWLLLLVVAAVVIVGKFSENKNGNGYSADRISVIEIRNALEFGSYAEEDWDTWFAAWNSDYLTGSMLDQLLARLGVEAYIEKTEMSRRHMVTRKEWNGVYDQILDYLDMEKEVVTTTFLVLDIIESQNENIIITNQGDYYTKLPISWFETWQAYQSYITGENLCIGIREISQEEQMISNAYVKNYLNKKVDFLYDGAEYEKEIGEIADGLNAGVYDFIVENGEVQTIRSKQDRITGDLLSYDDTTVEIEGYGKISHAGKIPVYQTYGEVAEKSISDVVLGNMEVEYITGENQVCAILIGQPASIENIRVLLLSTDGSNFRSDIYLKCTAQTSLNCGNVQETLAEGSVIHVTDYLSSDDSLILSPESSEGQILICDEDYNALSNGYYGSMEIRQYEEGYTLVNQLPLETYLCAVVPSEMPSNYEPEALKAQAICARSYAYIQLLQADLRAYGAHINDSTSYQVYNRIPPTEQSASAVYETAGKVLTYQGNVAEAYYFSTSMGYTDTAEIWNVENEADYGYLKQACLNTPSQEGKLSEEAAFFEYITKPAAGYDSDIKYYRWTATADYSRKSDTIREILESRHAVSGQNIQYWNAKQTTELESMKGMGALKSISVAERSDSGSILTLKLTYKKGVVLVKNEYNIRKILGCGVTKITYQDGSENNEVSMLPSSFCALTLKEDGTMLLSGGGYGHGLGMSQNGANGMAKAGMKCEDILQYFYNDIKIEDME